MKNLIQAAAVATLLASSTAQAQQAVQWRVEDGGNGHWYLRVPVSGGIGWNGAMEGARSRGAHLVSITSAGENAFLVSNGAQPYDLLGASTPTDQGCHSNTWTWASGEPWAYTNWALYEPSLHCQETVLVFAQNQFPKWNNFYGGSDGYWIEWSADCNNDGIVDKGQILTGQLADVNANGVPDICEVPTCRDADLFRDYNVNGADLGILLSQWGPSTPLTVSDINHDGSVNGADLSILLSFWGPCP